MSRLKKNSLENAKSKRLSDDISASIAPIVTQKTTRVEVKVLKRKATPRSTEENLSEKEPIPQRVFLYLKTVNIDNLPVLVDNHDVILRMKQGNNLITKVDDYYSDKTDANLSLESEEKPVYCIRLNQDDIDDLNSVCDAPLMITLYEHIPVGKAIRKSIFAFSPILGAPEFKLEPGSEEESPTATEDIWLPIAQGNLDLLQYFSQNKSIAENTIFLYPITISKMPIAIPTCQLTMQITSVLPLLKNSAFCNTAFITLESIYNANSDIMNAEPADLVVDLSFQSKLSTTEKVKFCSFSKFTKDILSQQNVKHKWESMKNEDMKSTSLGVYSGLSLSLHKLFVGLLGTEGVDFKFDEILQDEEYAIICNSVHRFALTKELSAILEDVIGFNEQHLLIELYRLNEPGTILLEGICDLSVFMYPKVNACRFAIELKSPESRSSKIFRSSLKKDLNSAKTAKLQNDNPNTDKSHKRQKLLKKNEVDDNSKDKPSKLKTTSKKENSKKKKNALNLENSTSNSISGRASLKEGKRKPSGRLSTQSSNTFAILNICLLTPITEAPEKISKFNENLDKKEKLKTCKPIKSEANLDPQLERKKWEVYKEIDEIVNKLIDYIVKQNIKYPRDAKEYFCCQLGNITNKLIKLIASDFNIRIPTKTNIEFVNLLTTVYKELEKRWYDIVKNCDDGELDQCFCNIEEKRWKIITAINMAKLTSESGKEELGSFMLEKIKKKNPQNSGLSFYLFIYDMEKLNYEAAKQYINKPLVEQLGGCEYHLEMVKIYIDYMEKLQLQDTVNSALEELLSAVRGFIEKNPKEIDFWILLHCIYSNCRYLPGIEFTRWKYENLYKAPRKKLPLLPRSLWSMNNNYKFDFKTTKGLKFYEVVETFLSLGLYHFAETVFDQISLECTDIEKYFIKTTFTIFRNEILEKQSCKHFPTGNMKRGDEASAFQTHINGHFENYRGNIAAAMKNYEKLLDMTLFPLYEDFQLGLLRLGYYMLETEHNYQKAEAAFNKCEANGLSCFLADFGLGKAKYKLRSFNSALDNFARATTYSMHIPDVWGYLALINLKLGENFKALECWKYAKLDPQNIISDEILEELSNINLSDVMLYVDMPENPEEPMQK